jgi:hypothetical protein
MSDKFGVTIEQSRWRAKIVTSLLPQPSVLKCVLNLKLSWYTNLSYENKVVTGEDVVDFGALLECQVIAEVPLSG